MTPLSPRLARRAGGSQRGLLAAMTVVGLLLTPSGVAQSSAEKAAVKNITKVGKTAFKTFRTETKTALKDVLTAIDDLGITARGASKDAGTLAQFRTDVPTHADALSADLGEFMRIVFREMNEAVMLLSIQGVAGLDALGIDGEEDSFFPQGFNSGDGGAVDDLGTSLRKDVDKLLLKVSRRMTKLAKNLKSSATVGLTFHLLRPTDVFEGVPNFSTGLLSTNQPTTVAHVLAMRDLTSDPQPADPADFAGVICLGGFGEPDLDFTTGEPEFGEVKLRAISPDQQNTVPDFSQVNGQNKRWRICLDATDGLDQAGNWLLEAFQSDTFDAACQVARVTIGIP